MAASTATPASPPPPTDPGSSGTRAGADRFVATSWIGRWGFAAGLAVIFVLGFAVRLNGIFRGGGLFGLGNYDDGVYFAAALGLVNGLLPYRDVMLLHPPGVVLALAPFAALSWLIGEPWAVAVARLSWMGLGALNAVLCGLVIRPLGRLAALVAALYYALSIGAVYVEHTVLLEPPATTVLLLALVITRLLGPSTGVRTGHYVAAGLLLGLSPVMKIWGVIAVLVVAGGIVYRRGWRPGLTTLFAAMASCAALCLPFFLSAPSQMWRMVVVAQVGRRRVSESEIERLNDVLGVREWLSGTPRVTVGLVVAGLVVLAALVVCVVRAELRVLAALLLTHGALVMTTPMWFLHYAGLTPAPIALALGGALAVLLAWCGARARWLPPVVAGVAALAVLVLAIPMTKVDLGGRTFPARTLAAGIENRPGCVTTDWPMALLLMDRLQRDIDGGCRLVVDLGGYSYYLIDSPYAQESRRRNEDWQRLALEYYRTGDAVISIRFSTETGFSKETARTIESWPILVESGRYEIRKPQPAGG